MKEAQNLLISRTRSGLNLYAKSEFSDVFQGAPLDMEVEKLRDGTKIIRFFSSPGGVHHVSSLKRSSGFNRRLFIQRKDMLKRFRDEFGPTLVEWSPGQAGEAYVRLPASEDLPPPTPFVHRGGSGGPIKSKGKPAPKRAAVDTMGLLDAAIRSVNELLARSDMSHVKLCAVDGSGELHELPGRKVVGKIERTLGE